MAKGQPRSEIGRQLVAAGYTPGTKEYRSERRTLERYTTTTGTQRRHGKADSPSLSKLDPAFATKVLQRQAVADAGRPQVGKRVSMRAYIRVGNDQAEQRRARTPRLVTSAPLTAERAKLLQENPLGFWQEEFGFDADADSDGDSGSIAELSIVSISYR